MTQELPLSAGGAAADFILASAGGGATCLPLEVESVVRSLILFCKLLCTPLII